MVAPDCDPLQKSSRNASCGAQYLLHRLRYFPGVTEAVADCDLSVAFSRWSQGTPATPQWTLPRHCRLPRPRSQATGGGTEEGGAAT